MLLQQNENPNRRKGVSATNDTTFLLRFNKLFYSINAIIAANTKFAEAFSSELTFAMLNIGPSLYHQVTLHPKGKSDPRKVHDYINEVFRYEHHLPHQQR